jgi:hypothetical protein
MNEIKELKRCNYCGKRLERSQFDASVLSKDGLLSDCRTCTPKGKKSNLTYKNRHQSAIRQYNRSYRNRNKPEIRQYNRAYRKKNREARRLSLVQWRKNNPSHVNDWRRRNPQAYAAHQAVERAIASGILQRPGACEKCQSPVPVHAHHEDYSKPLDVQWLCADCHWHIHTHVVVDD